MKKVYCDYCKVECRGPFITDKDGDYHSRCYDKMKKI